MATTVIKIFSHEDHLEQQQYCSLITLKTNEIIIAQRQNTLFTYGKLLTLVSFTDDVVDIKLCCPELLRNCCCRPVVKFPVLPSKPALSYPLLLLLLVLTTLSRFCFLLSFLFSFTISTSPLADSLSTSCIVGIVDDGFFLAPPALDFLS